MNKNDIGQVRGLARCCGWEPGPRSWVFCASWWLSFNSGALSTRSGGGLWFAEDRGTVISEEDAKIKVTQGRGMDLLRLEVVCVCMRVHTRTCGPGWSKGHSASPIRLRCLYQSLPATPQAPRSLWRGCTTLTTQSSRDPASCPHITWASLVKDKLSWMRRPAWWQELEDT